ncbi:predicted protein [Chaetoceros tenuissimus]|uniref:Uncharacterized protein n=1 Tax=Chaetoceros tenuissimus TaxID=426638 RepID=A0AAD3D5J6_9STRA|nr:predicted protein [Chaetoceros tenuissimus]
MNCFKKKRKKRERFLRKEQGRDSASYSVVHVSSNRNLERHHNQNTREEQSSSQSESTASPRGYEEEDVSYTKKKKRLWSKKPSPERHHDQMEHPRHTPLHEKNGNDRNRRHVKGRHDEYEEDWEEEQAYHSDKRRAHQKSSPRTRHNEVHRRSPDHQREGDSIDQSSSQPSSRKHETSSKSSNSHEKHGRRRMKNSSPPPSKQQMKPPSPVQTDNQEIVRGGAAEDPELLKELLAISAKHNKASERFSKVRKGTVPSRSAPVISKKSKQAKNEVPPWKRRDIPKKDSLVRFAQNVTYSEEPKAKEMMNDDENETPSWTAADDEKVQNLNGHIEVLKDRLARLAEKKQQRISNARRYNRDPALNAETQKIHRALIKVNNDLDRAENEARETRRKKREFETYQNVQEEIAKQEKKRQEKLRREKEMEVVRRELESKREKKEMKRQRHAHLSHDEHSSQDHYSGSYRANIDHLSPKNSYNRRPLDDDHYSSSYRANIEHLSPHNSAKKSQFIDFDEDDDDDDDDLERILDDQSVSISIEETSSDSREDPSYEDQDEKVKGYVDNNEPEDDEYEKFKQTLENSYHPSEFGSEYMMDDVEDEDLLFDREMNKMNDDDEYMEDSSSIRDDGIGKGDHELSQDKHHHKTHENLVGLSKKADNHVDNMPKSHSHGKRKSNKEGKKLDRNVDPVEEKDAPSAFGETKEDTEPISSGDIIENIEENAADSPSQSWNKEERGISYRFICTYPFWKLHAIMLDHVYIENQEAGLQLKDGMMRIQRVYDGEVNNPIMKKLLTIKLSYPGWEHDKKEALEHYLCFEDKEARDACVEIVKKHKKYKLEMAQKENSTDSTKDSTGESTEEGNVSEPSRSGAESSLKKREHAKLQRGTETHSKDDGTHQSDLSESLKKVMPLDAFDKVNFEDIGDWSVDKSSTVDRGKHSDKNDTDVFGSVDYSAMGDWSSSRNEKGSMEKSAPKRWEKPERRQTLQDIYEEEWKPWVAKGKHNASQVHSETVPNNFHSVDWKPVNRGTVLETQDTYSSSSSTPRETRRNIENKWMKQLRNFSHDRERPHSRDEVRSKLREIEERWRGRTIMT